MPQVLLVSVLLGLSLTLSGCGATKQQLKTNLHKATDYGVEIVYGVVDLAPALQKDTKNWYTYLKCLIVECPVEQPKAGR